jgi:VWFA-related protein
LTTAGLIAGLVSVSVAGQELVFKSSADRVTVAVVARDRHGRPMTGLSAGDFEILADGESRKILDFHNGEDAVSVALLVDASGSMRIAPKLQLSVDVARLLLATLKEGVDEAGLFVFDTAVRNSHPFTSEFESIRVALDTIHPYGSTSLYDAIAKTSYELSLRPGRRALVVLTDGVDTSSRLTAAEVSDVASGIDMPVYIVNVGGSAGDAAGNLADLARLSGGAFLPVRNASDGSVATRQIVTDLRHQYVLAFEPHPAPGWHQIEVRAARRVTLQARSGYWIDR